jgi:hypothetical protein
MIPAEVVRIVAKELQRPIVNLRIIFINLNSNVECPHLDKFNLIVFRQF